MMAAKAQGTSQGWRIGQDRLALARAHARPEATNWEDVARARDMLGVVSGRVRVR